MPKPSWQTHATKRDFSTRYDDVQITVFETQYGYSYSVIKGNQRKAGNLREATLEEAQEHALKVAEGL